MSGLAQRARTRSGGVDRRVLVVVAAVLVTILLVAVVAATQRDDPTAPAAPAAVADVTAAPEPGRPPVIVEAPAGVRLEARTPAQRLAALTAASSRRPQSVDVWLALGAAQLELGRRAEARRSFVTAGHLGGLDQRPAAALAVSEYAADRSAATIRQLDRLLAAARDARSRTYVRFSRAVVELWSGRRAAGDRDLRAIRAEAPESFYGTAADDLLHPEIGHLYPPYYPSFAVAETDLADLARRAQARPGDVRAQLAYAAALGQAGRRREAARVAAAARSIAPNDVEASTALAVLGFSKDDPSKAFAVVGPLARDHPRDPVPRFALAMMLTWLRRGDEARAQFRRVAELAPRSRLGRLAAGLARV